MEGLIDPFAFVFVSLLQRKRNQARNLKRSDASNAKPLTSLRKDTCLHFFPSLYEEKLRMMVAIYILQ